MALTFGSQEEAVKKEEVKEVAPQAEVAEAPVAEQEVEVVDESRFGILQDKVTFLAILGNPAKPYKAKVNRKDGIEGKMDRTTPAVVGYQFRLEEAMKYPDCGTTKELKNNPMDFEESKIDNWVEGKKGQIINLTPFETAVFLSIPELNGECSGGDVPVVCVYQSNATANKKNEVVIVPNGKIPRVALKAKHGSIKDHKIINVLETKDVLGPKGNKIKEKTIVAGFEKWMPLVVKSSGAGAGAGSKSNVKTTAQAFNRLIAEKTKKIKAAKAQ